MTRNFRDEWEAASGAQSHDEHSSDVAPEHVQDRVSSMLRAASTNDAAADAMPTDVEERMRAAFKQEFGAMASGFSDESTPKKSDAPAAATVMPLPGRGRPTTEDTEVTRPAGLAESQHTPTEARESGSPRQPGTSSTPAGVRSLDEHRARKKGGLGKAALALGAAAAVAIGAVAVSKSMNHNESSVADGADSAKASQNYASRVRVTQTETSYTSDGLARQAASLPASKSTPIEPKQADAQSLGPLATGTGVQSCLDAVDASLAQAPDKVYADFGTYDGKPAVIVVTVKDGKKTAWVVSRSCSKSSDLKAGPTSLAT